MALNKMDDFFNSVSGEYDAHMGDSVFQFSQFYVRISQEITATGDEIKILDLGIGTGLELSAIFERAPQAIIDGFDVSEKMLQKLSQKFRHKSNQIRLHRESYLTYPAPENAYDYVISVMTLHHLTQDVKLSLYKNIFRFLKDDGLFIEGDYYVTPKKEKLLLDEYYSAIDSIPGYQPGDYHIDIPFSVKTQKELLRQSGFKKIKVAYRGKETGIMVARKK